MRYQYSWLSSPGANIFVSSNGSIKLGDFGLSVQLKDLHKTKQQVGTTCKCGSHCSEAFIYKMEK